MKRLIIAATLALSACHNANPEPVLTPMAVYKPVAVSCVPPAMESTPVYPDTDDNLRNAKDAAIRYQMLYAGRKLRIARLGELEPVVAGCQKAVLQQTK